MQLLFGVLYVVAGFVITERPLMSTLIVTIFLAVMFIIGGAFRMLAALLIRFPQWGWALLNGAVTALGRDHLSAFALRRLVGGRPLGRRGNAVCRLDLDHARVCDSQPAPRKRRNK